MIALNLPLQGGHCCCDGSKLTLKTITPETEHLQFSLLVMAPPMAGLTGGLTEKRRQHEYTSFSIILANCSRNRDCHHTLGASEPDD